MCKHIFVFFVMKLYKGSLSENMRRIKKNRNYEVTFFLQCILKFFFIFSSHLNIISQEEYKKIEQVHCCMFDMSQMPMIPFLSIFKQCTVVNFQKIECDIVVTF
jgi:hypothetical protein